MAKLIEYDEYPASIYQLEDTDLLAGGPPNEDTGAGMDNIPHQQLAKRTYWLKKRVNALVDAVKDGSATVKGLLRLANKAEAEAMTSTTLAMSPARVLDALRVYGLGGEAVSVNDLNALSASCLFRFTGAITGAPDIGSAYDGVGIHLQSPLQKTQIVHLGDGSDGGLMIRLDDAPDSGYGPWRYISVGEQAISSLGSTGYQRLPSGLILQWGVMSGAAHGAAVTFPLAFPSACRAITFGDAGSTAAQSQNIGYSAKSATGFTASVVRHDGDTTGTTNFDWMAIGN